MLSSWQYAIGRRWTRAGRIFKLYHYHHVALLDGLEERGFARREAATGDRRSYALYLTSKGIALMQRLRELHELHESRMIARIGEDGRAQLLALLAAAREAFGPSQLEQDKDV